MCDMVPISGLYGTGWVKKFKPITQRETDRQTERETEIGTTALCHWARLNLDLDLNSFMAEGLEII